MGLTDDIKNFWRTGGVLMRLIMVNVAVWLGIKILGSLFFLMSIEGSVVPYLHAYGYLPELIKKPWTIITYMFAHEGFFHILFNMLILYYLGRIFTDLLGDKRLLGTYLLGGLCGLAFYLIAFNTFPVFANVVKGSTIIGASAGVMGVVFGIALYRPDYEIALFTARFIIKLKWLAAFYFIGDIISVQGSNSGGAIAHIGGALFGIVFASQLRKGNDLASGLGTWVLGLGGKRERKAKMKVERNKDQPKRKPQAATSDAGKQAKLDHILDKIGKSGYESLSKSEKDFLFKASND